MIKFKVSSSTDTSTEDDEASLKADAEKKEIDIRLAAHVLTAQLKAQAEILKNNIDLALKLKKLDKKKKRKKK